MKIKTTIILAGIVLLSLFFNLYNFGGAPACFNADEAAFSYNAYSILKTGRDEYGTFLPLRLKSFGDYKLPLFSYLSVPFIGLFGLNEMGARLPNTFLAILFPIAVFYFVRELFARDDVSLVASFLSATTLAFHILSRQAHEGYLAALLVTVTGIFFIRLLKKATLRDTIIFLISALLTLFSYQSSRVLIGIYFLCALIYFIPRKKGYWILGGFLAVLLLFTVTDVIYKPARVANLLFINNPGYSLNLNELRGEGGTRLTYNKLVYAPKILAVETLKYLSPQFLLDSGDENPRFGYKGMGVITPAVYLFLFVGLYFMFKDRERWRYILLAFLLLTPVAASLSWAGVSLTRSFYLFVPISIIAAYGLVKAWQNTPKNYRLAGLAAIILVHGYFSYYSWDFYLNHYFKRALIVRSWQCGYAQVGEYVKTNYDKYDKFYISKAGGEPYIFMLFYLQYPPEKYQKQASLTGPDQYGFGQVEQFDKFRFNFEKPKPGEKAVVIGDPVTDFNNHKDDFPNLGSAQTVKVGTEDMFQIYSD